VGLWKDRLPYIKPYYAVKSNHSHRLLNWLHQEGVAFDCASAREIEEVLSVGSPVENIVYANPCKGRDDISYANRLGIKTTVIDSMEEIDKIVEERWKGDALLRIRVDDTKSVVPFSRKFGSPLHHVGFISEYAKSKGLPLCGISFHVGSGCADASQYTCAILQASQSLDILKAWGHPSTTIDIGGGFTHTGFHRAACAITRAFMLNPRVKMIAEPGRFFSEGSHALFVKVIGKKGMPDGSPGYRYTLDESLYGQFSCIPFDCAKPKWIRVGEGNRKKTPAILFGRTCDSVDMIAMTESTEELMEGDWLLFPRMGAYTSVTSSEFNGFPRPPVYELDEPFVAPPMPETLVQYVTPVTVPTFTPKSQSTCTPQSVA
jgi:ornithine decarboxylase